MKGQTVSRLRLPRALTGLGGVNGLVHTDMILAGAVLAILTLLFLPAPSWLLDILLAISITFSVMVLMTALFTRRALEFSTFPAILLIATLLRLALNIASTRLILSSGNEGTSAAGQIIEAFGTFVMQGNTVIGMIVFAILVIVNFVVITKGSGRIAEVAARFSLDALPGKQMAIDADLSAGLINEAEARERRKTLEAESTFFGAMDGASKFVRGDAVAGLLITFINLIGGIVIGMVQQGMSFGADGQSYSLLTIGDGLVSQIPALIISIAAGLLVSKAGVDGAADRAMGAQFTMYPRALAMVSVVLLIFAVLPGMPILVFLTLAILFAGGAWLANRTLMRTQTASSEAEATMATPVEDSTDHMLAMDDLRLEVGYGLLPIVTPPEGPGLTDQIKALRKAIAQELGFVTPPIRILDNLRLEANSYVIYLKEQEIARGDVRPGQFLAMDPNGGRINLVGEPTKEPAFGLDALWIDDSQRDQASLSGLTVVDAATVMTTHVTEMIKTEAPALLSYAETKALLNALPEKHQALVSDLIPAVASVTIVQRVLQRLLAERVSIRDLPTILEALAERAPQTSDITALGEHVRTRLGRQILASLAEPGGQTAILMLSPTWEQAFHAALTPEESAPPTGPQLAMAPSKVQDFVAASLAALEKAAAEGVSAAIVTSATARPFVRSIMERVRAQTSVLSQNEIHPHTRLRSMGQI